MNANELADELDDYYIAITDEYTGFGYLKEAATMLRQQQAEIEDLKSANRFIQNFAEEQHQRAVALESELDRAVELYTDKAIENEALKAGKIRAYDNGVEDGRKPNTNLVKELTREDRLKLIGTLKWAEDLLREAGHDEAVDEVQDCIMLLRKAQENG